MASLIIEILDHLGKVKERHHEKSFPITIGRGYNNDIILNDPYISPSHISIETVIKDDKDTFIINDSNSENGVFNLHPFTKQQSIEIQDDTKIRIGHTDIRFLFTTHPVKETLIDLDKPSQLSMLANSNITLPFALIAFAITFMINDYIETITATNFQQLLSNLFPIVIFITLWAITWSALSKLITHRAHFYFHATWAFSLTLISIILENIAYYYEFSLSLTGAASIVDFIFGVIVISLLFYGHLHYSTTFTKIKAKQVSFISALLILSLIEVSALLNTPDYSNKPYYSSVVRPANFVLVRSQSLDSFFEKTRDLKNTVDNIVTDDMIK